MAAEDDVAVSTSIDPAVAGQDASAPPGGSQGNNGVVTLKGRQQWKEAHWQPPTQVTTATAASDGSSYGGGGSGSSRRPSGAATNAKGNSNNKGKGKAAAANKLAEQQEKRDRRRSAANAPGASGNGDASGSNAEEMGYPGSMVSLDGIPTIDLSSSCAHCRTYGTILSLLRDGFASHRLRHQLPLRLLSCTASPSTRSSPTAHLLRHIQRSSTDHYP